MKIIGTDEEINWVKQALMNNCVRCPYRTSCNKEANQDMEKYGRIQNSCKSYLDETIVFQVEGCGKSNDSESDHDDKH